MSTNPIDGIVPTLYIGLGGTGRNVLLRLRKRFRKHFNELSELSQFLLIDTDLRNPAPDGERWEDFESVFLRPEAGELVDCGIRPDEFQMAHEACEFRRDPRLRDWVDPVLWNTFNGMDYGAGMCRQLGRLAFILNYQKIRTAIVSHLRTLAKATLTCRERQIEREKRQRKTSFDESHNRIAERIKLNGIDAIGHQVFCHSLDVVVVNSLGGGTGSGMFLDLAYLVRDILRDAEFRHFESPFTTAIAILPTPFERLVDSSTARRLQQNTYAAFLEMESYSMRPGSGGSVEFMAPWEARREDQWQETERRIPGRPWDACYLVDDVHENLPGGPPLECSDLFQIVADFLHRSFIPTELATQYRNLRAKLYLLQEQTLASQFFDDLDPDAMVAGPHVLLETRVSCAYSSFGLAEITVAWPLVFRGAGYLLAAMVVEEYGLGDAARYPHEWYVDRAKEDLFGSSATGCPEFIFVKPDDLLKRLLTRGDVNFLEALNRQFEDVARLNPREGRIHLERALAEHRALLAPRARVHSLIEQDVAKLFCVTGDDGRLAAQLRATVRQRLVQLGLKALLILLKTYRDALREASRVLKERQCAPLEAAKTEAALFAPLRAAEESWMPGFIRKRRVAHEYAAACTRVHSVIVMQYEHVAIDFARQLYSDLDAFIGDGGHNNSESTLTRHYGEITYLLKDVGDTLRSRFQESCTGDSLPHTQQLQPEWTVDDYVAQIRNACLHHPDIGPVAASAEVVDWQRAAGVIARNLATDSNSDRAQPQLDLWEPWLQLGNSNDLRGRQRQENCEQLAAACRQVLQVSLLPERFESVAEFLSSISPDEYYRILCRLVDHGSVCLPLTNHDWGEHDKVALSRRQLLNPGVPDGNSPQNSENVERLCMDIQNLVRRQSMSADVRPEVLRTGSGSDLVLLTIVGGVALQLYSRIGRLKDSYYSLTRFIPLAHIDRRTSRDLPELLSPPMPLFPEIRQSAHVVLAGVLLGTIAREADGAFSITTKDRWLIGMEKHDLGRTMDRVIYHACLLQDVREYLRRWWADWTSAATLKSLAGLWVAIEASRAHVTDVYSNRVAGPRSVSDLPLVNLLRKLRRSVERDLESRPDGPALLERLNARAPAGTTAPDSLRAWGEQCLVRIGDLPLYRLDAERLAAIELP